MHPKFTPKSAKGSKEIQTPSKLAHCNALNDGEPPKQHFVLSMVWYAVLTDRLKKAN